MLDKEIKLHPTLKIIFFTLKREENKENSKFLLGEISKYLNGKMGKHILAYFGIHQDYSFSLADISCQCLPSIPAPSFFLQKAAKDSHPLGHRHMSRAVTQDRPPRAFLGILGMTLRENSSLFSRVLNWGW